MRPLEVRVQDRNRLRPLTWIALAGLVLGAAMAIFGLPPVDVHGFLHYAGIMGPFCGGTRSVWSAMSGDVLTSLHYNPVGIPLVLGAIAVLVRLVVGWSTGRWLNVFVRHWAGLSTMGGVLLVALMINQNLHTELLQTEPGPYGPIGPLLNVVVSGIALGIWGIARYWSRKRAPAEAPAGSSPTVDGASAV